MVSHVFNLVKNINIGIYSDTVNMIMSNFVWWYYSFSFTCSYHFQWPWPYFKVTAVSNSFNWKFHLYNCWLYQIYHQYAIIFLFLHMFKGDNWLISLFWENFNVGFFSDTVKASSFKLCMIVTLLRVYVVIVGLMTLILFEGHRCVKNINCKLHVLDGCYKH